MTSGMTSGGMCRFHTLIRDDISGDVQIAHINQGWHQGGCADCTH